MMTLFITASPTGKYSIERWDGNVHVEGRITASPRVALRTLERWVATWQGASIIETPELAFCLSTRK